MLYKKLKYLSCLQLSSPLPENYLCPNQEKTNAALMQLLPNANKYLIYTSGKNANKYLIYTSGKNVFLECILTSLNDKIPVLNGKLYIVAETANQPNSVDIFRIPNQMLLCSRAGRLLLFNNLGYCGFSILLAQHKINRQSLADYYNRYPYLLLLFVGLATIPFIFRRQRLTNNCK